MTFTPPELKVARHQAHQFFDALWQGGAMTRSQAYRWLQVTLELPEEEAHIAQLDVAQCERLIAAVKQLTHNALVASQPTRRRGAA